MTALELVMVNSIGVLLNSYAVWRLTRALREVNKTLGLHTRWLTDLSRQHNSHVSVHIAREVYCPECGQNISADPYHHACPKLN